MENDVEVSRKQPKVKIEEFPTTIEEDDKIIKQQEGKDKDRFKNNILVETTNLIVERARIINEKIDQITKNLSEIRVTEKEINNMSDLVKTDVEKLVLLRNKVYAKFEEYKKDISSKFDENRKDIDTVIEDFNIYITANGENHSYY